MDTNTIIYIYMLPVKSFRDFSMSTSLDVSLLSLLSTESFISKMKVKKSSKKIEIYNHKNIIKKSKNAFRKSFISYKSIEL